MHVCRLVLFGWVCCISSASVFCVVVLQCRGIKAQLPVHCSVSQWGTLSLLCCTEYIVYVGDRLVTSVLCYSVLCYQFDHVVVCW